MLRNFTNSFKMTVSYYLGTHKMFPFLVYREFLGSTLCSSFQIKLEDFNIILITSIVILNKNMSAIKLLKQFNVERQFYDEEDHFSANEDSSFEFSHSVFFKSSADTSDSIADDSHEDSIEEIEDSIMNWFARKGIASGNPEDVIEQAREKQRKNKRMEINMGPIKGNKSSSLMERRRKSMNLSL